MEATAMSTDDRDGKLAKFRDVTGADNERASFFLESANWNLEVALGSFFENRPDEEVEPMEVPPPPPPVEPEPLKPTPLARSGNVATLSDNAAGSKQAEDERQAFYAGGSSTSGQQILGPPKKSGEKFVQDLFKKARESGAEVVDPPSSGSKPKPNAAFQGVGFKLGSSGSGTSEQVAGVAVPNPPREFILKLWKNGFTVDDDVEVRPYNDPKNRAFLAAVMSGRIPDELVSKAEGGEVHVDMEDHKEEEFVKQRGARRAFAGSGHVLGGVTPAFAEVGESSSPAPPADPDSARKAQEDLKVDDSEPSTSIQIRLPDGKRFVVRVNHTHTVGDVRRFVRMARPDLSQFSLHTTFPPKELADDSISIQAAGLVGAAILLRKK